MDRTQKIVIGAFFALPALCCLGSVFSFMAAGNQADGEIKGYVKELRAMGWPTEPDDLTKRPTPSESENAAPLIRKATDLLQNDKEISASWKLVSRSIARSAKPADAKAAEAAFPKLLPVVALAEQIGTKTKCDFQRDWKKGVFLLFPEYSKMRDLARLLLIKAERQSKAGDPIGALKTISLSQGIARHAGSEPTLIALLVNISIESSNHDGIDKILHRHGESPTVRNATRKVLSGFDPVPSLRYYMGGEMTMNRNTIHMFKNVEEMRRALGAQSQDGQSNGPTIPLPPQILKMTEARFLKEYVAMAQSFPASPEDWQSADQSMSRMSKSIENDKSPVVAILHVILPVFDQIGSSVGRLIARRNVSATELDLLDAKKGNKFPTALPNKGSAMDPFRGMPLCYAPGKDSFLLYSVGSDKNDDGGAIDRGDQMKDIGIRFQPLRK